MKLIERGKAMSSLKTKNIIDKMSLEDKVKLCSGADFWNTEEMDEYGIGKISMSDGPHGLRKQEGAGDHLGINDSVPATCFPTACCSSSTWNVDLLEKMGRAIAEEALEYKVDVVLGPGVNIKRNPLCGRNFEYFSEDPYVAGKLGAAWIKGVEGQGVGTSLKHFAGNNQENERLSSDSIIDERTLREIYLAPFEIAVKEGKPKTVMCAYNKINGTYLSDNNYILRDILRDEWGFEGFVMTDWYSISRVNGANKGKNVQGLLMWAGNDCEMPGGNVKNMLTALNTDKTLRLGDLQKSAVNMLNVIAKSAVFENMLDKLATSDDAVTAAEAKQAKAILTKNKAQKVLDDLGYESKEDADVKAQIAAAEKAKAEAEAAAKAAKAEADAAKAEAASANAKLEKNAFKGCTKLKL